MLRRRALLKLAFVAPVAGALLAACRAAVPAATSAPAQSTAAPRSGGTLVVAQEVDPVTLDPHKIAGGGLEADEHVYESLTRYDQNLNVQPSLAESWDISTDGLEYTFHLRSGVKWQDGKPFTSNDVKYWFDRLTDPSTASPWRSDFDAVDHVETAGTNAVKFVLKMPFVPLLSNFAGLKGTMILQDGAADRMNLATAAIGTGPFKLVEYVPQDHVRYERNPDYWGPPPNVDAMVYKVLPDEAARVAALRSGQADYALLSKQGADQLRGQQGVNVIESPKAYTTTGVFNTGRAPFGDTRVRQALRMAIDTTDLIQKAASGAGTPVGPIPTGLGNWSLKPEDIKYLKPDPAGATALLKEAGVTDLHFGILVSSQDPEGQAISLVAQEAWRQIGVTTELVQVDQGTWLKRYLPPAFDFDFAPSSTTFSPDPDAYLYTYFHSKGIKNFGGYSNARLDQLLDQGRTTTDLSQRQQIYYEAEQIVEDEVPRYFLYQAVNFEAASMAVKGYTPSFTGRRPAFATAWLER